MQGSRRHRGLWFTGLVLGAATAGAVVAWIGDGGGIFRIDAPAARPAERLAGSSGFPLTKTDYFGYEVTLPSPPESIASHALATDHLLFAIVPDSRIATVSAYASQPTYSNIHERVEALGLPTARDPETVLALRPDLVLSSQIADPQYLRLVRASGLPVFAMRTVLSTLEEVESAIRTIGGLTGESSRAQQLAQDFRASLNRAKRLAAQGASGQRVLGISSYFSAYGAGSLFESVVVELGAVNIGTEQGLGPWKEIGPEQIAAWNADWIVSGSGGRPVQEVAAALAANPAIQLTEAGKRGQLVVVEDRHFLSMSHHIIGLADAVAGALSRAGSAEQ